MVKTKSLSLQKNPLQKRAAPPAECKGIVLPQPYSLMSHVQVVGINFLIDNCSQNELFWMAQPHSPFSITMTRSLDRQYQSI